MIDIHVHYGQYEKTYFDVFQVISDLEEIGITKIGLMPFLTKNGDNIFHSHQTLLKVIKKNNDKIIPILWIHPKTSQEDIVSMLNELPYRILKVHGYLHDWHNFPKASNALLNISRKKNIPIMFHTGGRKESYAFSYKKICMSNPDITFILAHSRPVKGTINVMKECQNVYCDISFTPIKDIFLLIENGMTNKMLWGTDYPVYSVFNPIVDINQWYNRRVEEVKSIVGFNAFNSISETNILNIL